MPYTNLELILVCGSYLGVLPSYDFKAKKHRNKVLYPSAVCILLVSSGMALYYDNFMNIAEYTIGDAVGFTTDGFCLICSLLNIGHVTLGFPSTKDLLEELLLLETLIIRSNEFFPAPVSRFFLKYITLELLLFLLNTLQFVLGLIIWPFWVWFANLSECLQRFHACSVMLLHYYILKLIYILMSVSNDLIEADYLREITGDCSSIDYLIYLEKIMLDVCDKFNRFIGWSTLCFMYSNVFVVLAFILNLFEFDLDLVSWAIIASSLVCFAGLVILVSHVCEGIEKESKRTVSILTRVCGSLAYNIAARKRILLLTQQAHVRLPRFTAANFFRLNHSMLFAFTNMITVYVIVIVQMFLK